MFVFSQPIIVCYILCIVSTGVFGQDNWKDITSVSDVCKYYPETMKNLLNHLNLDHRGLENVKVAKNQNKIVDACKFLLAYYRNGTTPQQLRKELPVPTSKRVSAADTILKNVFNVQNVRGQLPYGDDGHRDWYYKGPNNDREWAWLSNRHSQLNTVFNTYFETGNPIYAEYIDLFLKDFIIKNMPYPGVKSQTSVWRGLEVAARAKVWSRIFYGLVNSEYISPATKLLILSSLPDHAHYNRNFHGGNNWLTMEISALATIAANFPEFKASDEWLTYAVTTMTKSMEDQVYPDGVQTELTSHYHNVSLHNFELFEEICKRARRKLPDFYYRTIADMYSYIAHAMRPDGFRILNNDGDRGSDRSLILAGAKKFNNPEWEYIATNGRLGTKPLNGPSSVYPWAGQLISRSGYGPSAHWSFFDIGPWGSGHQHNDKLHISISAFGKDFLVDSGRFAYTGEVAEKFRPYAKGSSGHNVILIDGKGQDAGPTHANAPLAPEHFKITNDFDYASGSFDDFRAVDGQAEHTRSIFYLRGKFWVVVDRIATDRPRQIDALWHWHPETMVTSENSMVKASNGKGNLAIVPISGQTFSLKFIKGQETPEMQGWYSPEYNIIMPNVTSIYSTDIDKSSTFTWLIVPADKTIPNYTTEIISEDEIGVTVLVKSKQNTWRINIPYNESKYAAVKSD